MVSPFRGQFFISFSLVVRALPPVCGCHLCFALLLRTLPLSVRYRSCLAALALPPVSDLRHPRLQPPISHLRPPPTSSIAIPGEFKKRKTELSQVALSLDNEGDVEASKEGLDIPDDYTIWNKVVTKEKKKATFGLGSFGLDLYSKLDSRNCSETSKDNLNIEQELHMWEEKANE
ncbi:hypothetical protein Ahy_B01g052040 [Arachis hypogaea]|uniref:Uncharacterized protein n=1 Tax=Arachis hypogaea TaxID=3818 RepID=A0A445ANG9_ARAHY|nr:hypothetical protein Ahy_B01g052040 [Arachis hypogaea]